MKKIFLLIVSFIFLSVMPSHTAPLTGLYMVVQLNTSVSSSYPSYCSGVTLRQNTSDNIPSSGTYSWSYIDSSLSTLSGSGLKSKLQIFPGVNTLPSWVQSISGIQIATLYNTGTSSYQTMIVPWDPVYIAQVAIPFIDALAAKYASNPQIAAIDMSAPTGHGEMFIPEKDHSGTDPYVIAAGYTPDKLYTAWKAVIDEYATKFPTTQCCLDLGYPYAATDIITSATADSVNTAGTGLLLAIVKYAKHDLGTRLCLQTDGLKGSSVSTQLSYYPNQLVSLNSSANNTSHPVQTGGCNGGGEATSSAYLVTKSGGTVGSYPVLFQLAGTLGAQFVEIYDGTEVLQTITLTNGGSGYCSSPAILFPSSVCDTNPRIGAVVNPTNGTITKLSILRVGTNCTSLPSVAIYDCTGDTFTTRATATATIGNPFVGVFSTEAAALAVGGAYPLFSNLYGIMVGGSIR